MSREAEALRLEFIEERRKLLKDIQLENEALSPRRWSEMNLRAYEASKEEYFLHRDFYLVYICTNETTPDKTPRPPMVICRRSCPSPGYNQNVFKYHYLSSELEYLWTIPRQHIYWNMYKNKAKYLQDKVTKKQMSYIILMETGELLKWAKRENGELPDAVIKINNPPQLAEA